MMDGQAGVDGVGSHSQFGRIIHRRELLAIHRLCGLVVRLQVQMCKSCVLLKLMCFGHQDLKVAGSPHSETYTMGKLVVGPFSVSME